MCIRRMAVLWRGGAQVSCLVSCLVSCFVASGAWACSIAVERGQVTVYGQLGTAPGQLPQEVELKTGDLLSVLAPSGARMRVVDANGKDVPTVVQLDAQRYQALSAQGRGTIPVEVRAQAYPKSLAWQHFGAAEPGVVYLKLSVGKERGVVRVRIVERPAIRRGTDVIWTDSQQQEPLYLTQFDTLTLDLPGGPGDGWQVHARSGKAMLKSASQASTEAKDLPGRVRLQVDVSPGAPEDELTVRRGSGEMYRFVVRPKPVPAC